ncbi:AzlD domain-containing protein [Polynucleobacter kasalickyi]|uniref:Branched-chain amino acid transport protein (AzlD) n=1 Tax=Polynucleobacter kasalickyi TaxID=1938817 RepID=A0A1W1ZLF3_9BURK|nr:AzlD domain-containing protein [Polynucleobacter kasalickyi]SMC49390.1 Branched-chain amino acid transport protein (AzlD) [Polynucleobacter kasalickyi]
MEALFTKYELWAALIFVILATYFWRGLGVLASGRINKDGEIFKWLSAVTYAILGSLTLKLILLPVGLLSQIPMYYRIFVSAVCLFVMLSKKGRLVPALVVGSVLIMLYDFIKDFF